MSDKLGKSKEFKRLVTMVQQGQQTTFDDIRQYELLGAAAMAMPVGAQRWNAILALCRLIKNTEPAAFEVAEDWIKCELGRLPIIAYTEPFGEWWLRHYNLNPIRKEWWLRLNGILGDSEAAVSWYADKAIGIYVVLRAQVPNDYIASDGGTLFHVDGRLQSDEAKKVLSVVEGVAIQVKGKGVQKVIDTSTTPWSYASKAALRYTAKCVGNILGITEKWHVFEQACGVKNLQSKELNEPIEVKQALEKAGYSDFDR